MFPRHLTSAHRQVQRFSFCPTVGKSSSTRTQSPRTASELARPPARADLGPATTRAVATAELPTPP